MRIEDTDIGESWVECQFLKLVFSEVPVLKETAVAKQVETTEAKAMLMFYYLRFST